MVVGFGQAVESEPDLSSVSARELVTAVSVGAVPGVAVTALRESAETGNTAVALDIEVERPQDLAYPIRATEPVAVVFAAQGAQPRVARRFSGYAAPELDTARCAMFAVRR